MVDVTKSQDVYKDIGHSVKFVVMKLKRSDYQKELEDIQKFSDRLPSVINSLLIRQENSQLKVAVGFSKVGWEYLFPKAKQPKELETFEGLKNKDHQMPATQGDIFMHVRASDEATVFELVDQLISIIKDDVDIIDETAGFRYFEGRSIVGFIDGTEAPAEQDAKDYALIGDEDSEFENGSYAFAQKWIHDMNDWNQRSVETQEKQIGRHKFSDFELEDSQKAKNAHNVASKIEIDGIEQKIVRMNVPFSKPATGETGTYFIGYARHWKVTKAMLEQMIIFDDALFSFSTITTGQLFFIPSRETMQMIADGDFE